MEFLPDFEATGDYRINSESALVAPISARLGLNVGYVVRYNDTPPGTKVKTDRLLTTGLQISY